jgi:anti-sigma factor ChrR (cupin superfamily)
MLARVRIPGWPIAPRFDGVPWRSTGYPGIFWLGLHPSGADDSGDTAALIRMDPGCGYPPHRHVGIEDVLVLCGSYRDELGVHEAGSYVRYDAGSPHAPIALGDGSSPPGRDNPSCVLFAVARGGVELLEEREDRGRSRSR